MEGDNRFDLERLTGLSGEEASRRLVSEGYNEIPSAKGRSFVAIALDVASEPMFLLLVACGLLYMALGDIQEALILLTFVFLVMGITLFQERKSERALEALRDLSSPRALVVRDGAAVRIPGREVARGDTVLLAEGDRVPADGVLVSAINIVADESLLTGESVPVAKSDSSETGEMGPPGGEGTPWVFSGSLIVRGQGVVHVLRTGANTGIGDIGRALGEMEPEKSLLWKETRRVVRLLAEAGFALCLLVVVFYYFTVGGLIKSLLAGLTLAMSIMPEEMPVILTIFLALGAWRIAQKNVLTRHMPVIETLGAATVLCVDKTGTLTENRMSVRRLYADGADCAVDPGSLGELPDQFHELVEYCILAGKKDPFDPMEHAVAQMGARYLGGSGHLHSYDRALIKEYPLSRAFPALTHVWRSPGREGLLIASKGAPETIAHLCHMDDIASAELKKAAHEMARAGLRVLAVAKGWLEERELPADQHDFDLTFVGLVGFADPVRQAVPPAVEECYRAGIRVIMITGDYPETAMSIARASGIDASGGCITGAELSAMDEASFSTRIMEVNVFARAVPEQKLRIVEALKKHGQVVAMTGDGVNDATALKSAHIGIAMGGRGTDVAREAASLVLTDDDFSSIVAAVRMGRRIYDNIKKAMAFTLAVHVPIAGMALFPALAGLPLIFMPVHIVFLEMIIDPACSIVFEAEAEEAGVMSRPPRKQDEALFSGGMVWISLFLGTTVFMLEMAVFWYAGYHGGDMERARTLCFATQVVATMGLIFINRSWERAAADTLRQRNRAFWYLLGGGTMLLVLLVYLPLGRSLFRFVPMGGWDWAICLAAGSLVVVLFEGMKRSRRGKRRV